MRRFTILLAATTALTAAPALAQSIATTTPVAADDTSDGAEITVFGRGQTRQVGEISQAEIASQAPATSVLKALDKLPSVNFQSADPFGVYEWSERITVRGFDQSRLGFTLDGIPLGNQNYGNNNGLHTSRAISSENVATTLLTQGAGSVSAQATNNLGGTVEITSRDPSTTPGGDASLTYGNYNTFRGFVRLETGGEHARAYVSYGYLGLDKWKGFGRQYQHQINAKGVIDAGAAKITAFFDFSDRREQDYQDLDLRIINRLGYGVDNIANNYPLAVQIADVAANRGDSGATPLNPAAGTVYPAPYTTVDDVYFDASGLRRDYLGSLGIDVPLADKVTFSAKGYYHNNHGQGTWFTPYVPSPSGSPISVRTTEYDIKRKGIFGDVKADLGWSNLTVGAGTSATISTRRDAFTVWPAAQCLAARHCSSRPTRSSPNGIRLHHRYCSILCAGQDRPRQSDARPRVEGFQRQERSDSGDCRWPRGRFDQDRGLVPAERRCQLQNR